LNLELRPTSAIHNANEHEAWTIEDRIGKRIHARSTVSSQDATHTPHAQARATPISRNLM